MERRSFLVGLAAAAAGLPFAGLLTKIAATTPAGPSVTFMGAAPPGLRPGYPIAILKKEGRIVIDSQSLRFYNDGHLVFKSDHPGGPWVSPRLP